MIGMVVAAASRTLTAPERVVVVAISLGIAGLGYGATWLLGRAPARWTEHRPARVAGYVVSMVLYLVIIGGINLALIAAIDPSGESGG